MNTPSFFNRSLFLACAAALLLLAAPMAVQGQFTYSTNNGAITITGYTGSSGAVAIPDMINGLPVTSIGSAAFATSGLTSITIPNSVTNVGDNAFNDCFSITNVIMGGGVSAIGTLAFYACMSLPNVTIPNSVNSIGGSAFENCVSLTNVTIPNSVTNIGDGSFANTGLASVTIPNSISRIGTYVFYLCISLNSVTVSDGVTDIGVAAFAYSGVTNVTIPSSVTSIESSAFESCLNLAAIVVDGLNPAYSSLSGVLFDKSQTMLIVFPDGKAGSYTIGNGVTSIGYRAFADCQSLTSITIGNSVTNIGGAAFANCIGLAKVNFTGNAPDVDSSAFVYWIGMWPTNDPSVIYFLPGKTGWGPTFGGLPTTLWTPEARTNDGSLGVQTNQFGFNIAWASGQSVVVEAATNLSNPVWIPVATNTLASDSVYFSDPEWANYPARFYRLRSP